MSIDGHIPIGSDTKFRSGGSQNISDPVKFGPRKVRTEPNVNPKVKNQQNSQGKGPNNIKVDTRKTEKQESVEVQLTQTKKAVPTSSVRLQKCYDAFKDARLNPNINIESLQLVRRDFAIATARSLVELLSSVDKNQLDRIGLKPGSDAAKALDQIKNTPPGKDPNPSDVKKVVYALSNNREAVVENINKLNKREGDYGKVHPPEAFNFLVEASPTKNKSNIQSILDDCVGSFKGQGIDQDMVKQVKENKDKVHGVSEDLTALEKRIGKAEVDIGEHDKRLDTLESGQKDIQGLKEGVAKFKDLEPRVQKNEGDIASLKEIKADKGLVEKQGVQLKQQSDQLTVLGQQVETKEAKLDETAKRTQKHQSQLTEHEAGIKENKEAIENSQVELGRQADKLEETANTAMQAQESANAANAELKTLREEFQQNKNELAAVKNQLNETQQGSSSAEQLIESLRKEIAYVRECAHKETENVREAAHKEVEAVRENAHKEAENLRETTYKEITKLSEEIDRLRGQLDQRQTAQGQLEGRHSELSSENRRLVSETESLNLSDGQPIKLRVKVRNLSSDGQKLDQQTNALQTDTNTHDKQVQDLANKVDQQQQLLLAMMARQGIVPMGGVYPMPPIMPGPIAPTVVPGMMGMPAGGIPMNQPGNPMGIPTGQPVFSGGVAQGQPLTNPNIAQGGQPGVPAGQIPQSQPNPGISNTNANTNSRAVDNKTESTPDALLGDLEKLIETRKELGLIGDAKSSLDLLKIVDGKVDGSAVPEEPVVKVRVGKKLIQIAPPSKEFEKIKPKAEREKILEDAKKALENKEEEIKSSAPINDSKCSYDNACNIFDSEIGAKKKSLKEACEKSGDNSPLDKVVEYESRDPKSIEIRVPDRDLSEEKPEDKAEKKPKE